MSESLSLFKQYFISYRLHGTKQFNIQYKLRAFILKLGFSRLLLSNLSNSNKTVHGDKAQLPPISQQGLACLSLLPDAAVTCTKKRISKIGPQKSN